MAATRCHVALDDHGGAVAVATAAVTEVVEEPPITPIPMSDRRVVGVCNLRGAPVPVVDLALLLGMPAPSAGGILVVVRHSGRRIALRARRVHGLVSDEGIQADPSAPAWCDAMVDVGGTTGRQCMVRGIAVSALETLLSTMAAQ